MISYFITKVLCNNLYSEFRRIELSKHRQTNETIKMAVKCFFLFYYRRLYEILKVEIFSVHLYSAFA